MKIINKPLSELIPANYNPRQIKLENYRALSKSIEKFGFIQPIIWNERTGNIVGGHQRLKVLQDQGITNTDVTVVDLSLADEKKLNITLNNPFAQGTFTDDIDSLLTEFTSEDFSDLSFDKLTKPVKIEVEEDYDDSYTELIGLGDSYRMRDHKLICTDAFKFRSDSPVQLLFADPPYDIPPSQDFVTMLKNNTENSHIFIMYDDKHLIQYLKLSPFAFRRFFICDTQAHTQRGTTPHPGHIAISHETDGQPSVYSKDHSLISHEVTGSAAPMTNLRDSFNTIIRVKYRNHLKNRIHPHEKPPELTEELIKHYTKPGDTVLDLFGGSGSTLIACERLRRNCLIIEKDEKTANKIIARWENYTKIKGSKC